MATLREIADKVGVSIATVSRVLNNDSGIVVADETKVEIFQVAEELNYQTAKQRKGKNKKKDCNVIGIVEMYDVVQQLEDPYYLLLKNVVDKNCFQNNIQVIKFFKQGDSYVCLEDKEVEGIIAIGKFDETEIDDLYQKTSNVVFIDSSPDEEIFDAVKINFNLGVKQALKYLIKCGHKEIGFIGERNTLGDLKIPSLDARLKYYLEYMQEEKILNEDYIINASMNSKGGYEAIVKYISEGKKMPTAFLAANDSIATGVIRGLQEHGLSIPNDVSIIGFNDTIVSKYTNPPLTSIGVYVEELAEEAVALMLERLNNKRVHSKLVIIPTKLIERESVKTLL